MPLYDYECQACDHVHERIERPDDMDLKECPACGMTEARRIISCGEVYTGNQDATWLKSVTDVIGAETREGREAIANPTRDNIRRWQQKIGVRHLEPGEKGGPNRPKRDMNKVYHRLAERSRKRMSLTVGTM